MVHVAPGQERFGPEGAPMGPGSARLRRLAGEVAYWAPESPRIEAPPSRPELRSSGEPGPQLPHRRAMDPGSARLRRLAAEVDNHSGPSKDGPWRPGSTSSRTAGAGGG